MLNDQSQPTLNVDIVSTAPLIEAITADATKSAVTQMVECPVAKTVSMASSNGDSQTMKKAISLSKEQIAGEKLQKAAELANAGQVNLAIQMMKELLKKYPTFD